MEQITDNMQKYANYKEQMGRLSKALTQGFFLEAIFIEYAILEDRLESILRHSGNGIRMQRTLCHWIKSGKTSQNWPKKRKVLHINIFRRS